MKKSFTRVPKVVFDIVVCLDASFETLRCVTLLLYLTLPAVHCRQVTAGPQEASAPCSFTFSPPLGSVSAAVVLIDFLRKSNLSCVIRCDLDCRN